MSTINFKYIFTFENGSQEIFDLIVDKQKLVIKNLKTENQPAWTAIDFCQCSNCPFDASSNKHCPVALCLTEIAKKLGDSISYEKAHVEVITNNRHVYKNVTIQQGTAALLGLYMAVSGCPHTAYFKPMACFHLPFASEEETAYRSASMYFLAQFFVNQSSGVFETGLDGLKKIYKEMQTVNAGIAKRIRNSGDYKETNAITMLDFFSQMMQFSTEDALEDIRHMFSAYLPEE